MTTIEDIFLADIVSRPDDTDARLIYADWLRDNDLWSLPHLMGHTLAHPESNGPLFLLGHLLAELGDPRRARLTALVECRRRAQLVEPGDDTDALAAGLRLDNDAGASGTRLWASLSAARTLLLTRDSRSHRAAATVGLHWCGLAGRTMLELARKEARLAYLDAEGYYAFCAAQAVCHAAVAATYPRPTGDAFCVACSVADAEATAFCHGDDIASRRKLHAVRGWAVAVAEAIPGWLAEFEVQP